MRSRSKPYALPDDGPMSVSGSLQRRTAPPARVSSAGVFQSDVGSAPASGAANVAPVVGLAVWRRGPNRVSQIFRAPREGASNRSRGSCAPGAVRRHFSGLISSRLMIRLLAILLFAADSVLLSAAAAAPDFEKGNELYEKGQFPEAAATYEEMLRAGEVSPALYFNQGNAYFKSGQIGRAIFNYRLANQLAPRDPDIRANLQFARNSVNAGAGTGSAWWQRTIQRLTLDEWTLLVTVVFWTWLLVLALGQWRPSMKPSLRGLTLAAAAALVVCGTGFALAWNARYRVEWAIVVAREAVVRNGPLDESPSYYTVHDGVELEVLDTKEDWLQVTDAARRTGWLRRPQAVTLGGA